MTRETHYLNTDLDITAPHDLTPLADALAQRGLYPLHVLQQRDGSWSSRFETEEGFREPDSNIAAMLTAIESLEEPARSLWANCTLREFDMGYDCGEAPNAYRQPLTATTIARIAAVGASVVITLYPQVDTESIEAAVKILKKDKSIKSHIGKYTGYGYNYTGLPSLKKGLAEVKVNLVGNKGSVYVHCRLKLSSQVAWVLGEIIKKEERGADGKKLNPL